MCTLEPSRPRPSASLREYVWLACFHCAPAPAAPPRLPILLRSNTLNFSGPPNSGRSVAEWAPSLKRATDACVLASNNASPAQRGPRRDAQPLHATPLAAVLFPAPLRARALLNLLCACDSTSTRQFAPVSSLSAVREMCVFKFFCGVPVLVPVRASPVPSVVRGSFVVKFFRQTAIEAARVRGTEDRVRARAIDEAASLLMKLMGVQTEIDLQPRRREVMQAADEWFTKAARGQREAYDGARPPPPQGLGRDARAEVDLNRVTVPAAERVRPWMCG